MPPAVVLILYALAVARATTLITHDEITSPARAWLIHRFNPASRLHRWVVYAIGAPDDDTTGCPWCVSVWVAAATATPVWYWHTSPWLAVPLLAAAASQATGMIYQIGRT